MNPLDQQQLLTDTMLHPLSDYYIECAQLTIPNHLQPTANAPTTKIMELTKQQRIEGTWFIRAIRQLLLLGTRTVPPTLCSTTPLHKLAELADQVYESYQSRTVSHMHSPEVSSGRSWPTEVDALKHQFSEMSMQLFAISKQLAAQSRGPPYRRQSRKVSVIQPRGDKHSLQPVSYTLQAANRSTIPTYCEELLTLDLGLRRQFPWRFTVADVQHPIVGIDFLSFFGLTVDVGNRNLIDSTTALYVHGKATSINSIGLRSALPDNGFAAILRQFPQLTNPSNATSPPKHDVFHHIVTKGPPTYASPRRLPPHKLKVAKVEVEHLLRVLSVIILKPLTDILKANPKHFVLFPEADSAFLAAKEALSKATTLTHLRTDERSLLILKTDASQSAVGAVLQQNVDGEIQPLSFFSRKLQPAQTRYSTFVHRYFPRETRHLDFISQFTTDIRFIDGSSNFVANALSRSDVSEISASVIDFLSLAKSQVNDPELRQLRANPSLKLRDIPLAQPEYIHLRVMSTGISRPFVPLTNRFDVFSRLHSLSHPSIRASKKLVTERYI
ncbi:uncharacterized protein DEA37_0005414 [Paragonimus westermani]|uniref:Reverse transcriptase/retrotransposon-derived protein RNase H-like domain-containing protein n=1 Tax=Paragonimus westermani TaxID=34504 RepID=A0A5J4NME5_9TREM|nr:uncharacterized protein DEA37_0005414 [Paragonimus westermani]